MSDPIAVYLHTPFCPTKCGYCDFNSFALAGAIHERTVRAIVEEIKRSPIKGRPAKTIFFGGGTPTYLTAEQLRRLLAAVIETHPPIENCEITSEANPGTVDIPKFAAMREMGFNRISMGAQSFLDEDLERLGRVHRSEEIVRAFHSARKAGFENVNLDLMFALPHQTIDGWKANLEKGIALGPEHLSLYCLTLEPNTPFHREHRRGNLVVPEEDAQIEMYDLAVSLTKSTGYEQYEISNFAKPGFECKHNLMYWRWQEYAGYGPGAVGCYEGRGSKDEGRIRYTNLKHPNLYCDAIEKVEGEVRPALSDAEGSEPSAKSNPARTEPRPPIDWPKALWCESEEITADKARLEHIMLGIRLNEGLPLKDLPMEESQISNLKSKGWIERENGTIRLTPEGRHWCSEVALKLA